ncbi:hypothetical protein [Acinetobacter wuhouensis]|uniref:hypothetical protein n=1 Tax=Acinetobacter wuhouensis TaxID=1879050 RepID=UPI001BC879ED|nr:hypothetical protein [Acinetobacter wuhouensis]
MFKNETPLALVVDAIEGKQSGAGEVCGVTAAVIGRWIKQQYLPRTEYTGETSYAESLANATAGRFSKDWILLEAHPLKVKDPEAWKKFEPLKKDLEAEHEN